MKKILKIIALCIETAVLFVIVGGLTSAITKSVYSDILIEQFKSKAIYQESESSDRKKVYAIPSLEERPVFQKIGNDYYPGETGDILITLQSELTIPFVRDIVSFFAGGHAAIVLGDYEDLKDKTNSLYTVESSGLNEDLNLADTYYKRYWTDYPHPIIGLRVSTTEFDRAKVISRALALVGDPYNYSFLFDTENKSYCSDLVGKAYASIGVNLNKDGFTTSIYDLLLSGETYMTYYRYFDTLGIEYIYYLDTK
ncbi:MAG: hypothetical protein K2N64_02375 [Anaeroplasmataceae bacterium]|nr:hypothetical protein [Anaeroplasmataceae bacterium]